LNILSEIFNVCRKLQLPVLLNFLTHDADEKNGHTDRYKKKQRETDKKTN